MNNKSIVLFKGVLPKIGENVFIADNARIIGNVEASRNVSFWYNSIVRGDINNIRIGALTAGFDCIIGEYVTR